MVQICTNSDDAVDTIINKVGKRIVIAMPPALGIPPHLINALFKRAQQDSSIQLDIIGALILEKPKWSSDFERRMPRANARKVLERMACH